MKLIVGLGNPGPQYARTRHNAGFLVVDRLAEKHAQGAIPKARFNSAVVEFKLAVRSASGSGEVPVLLMKPTTFMNRSGQAVGEAIRFYKLDPVADLLVIVDEVYLPLGQARLQPSGGTAGHNGMSDIHRALGASNYPRLRVGVGPKPEFIDQADFVLGRFTDEESRVLSPAIDRAAQACATWVAKGLDAAMNQCNAPDKPPRPPRPPSDKQPSDPPSGSPPEA
jgi:PTH1 family peptidyl-tRNA hydrolase